MGIWRDASGSKAEWRLETGRGGANTSQSCASRNTGLPVPAALGRPPSQPARSRVESVDEVKYQRGQNMPVR